MFEFKAKEMKKKKFTCKNIINEINTLKIEFKKKR